MTVTLTEEQLKITTTGIDRSCSENLEKVKLFSIKKFMNVLMSGFLKDIRSHQVLSNIMMHTIILINKYPYIKK